MGVEFDTSGEGYRGRALAAHRGRFTGRLGRL